ncbi:LRR receptor-like serine/threonine-protein kinase GSO1 isoform X2 [Malania oleifera]|uniref:LRR receptor-like serine/threonine-protein kinase GSO1 isoform X2 n=1 Tax=Malania oleifera TaxID=397392 RepID=UPI0025AE3F0F|nr:LRR receptor-like serine/threonine-protein kinase GSO1 isoform X2 [Malania oleifera]
MEKTSLFFSLFTLLVQLLVVNAITKNITTDQSALLAFKDSITYDPQELLATNWSTTTSVCSWIGIACSSHHLRVTALNLSYMGLTGTIPPQLGNMSFLVELELKSNSFHGSLPRELAHLLRLNYINFGFNNLSGEIPSWIGSLPNLQFLNLYGNQFSGSIPGTLFNISSLQVLDLSENQLSGGIPSVVNATSLQYLILYDNQLSASSTFSNLGMSNTLEFIDLHSNSLSGSIPGDLFRRLPKLEGLYLSSNQFSGELPSSLFFCKRLQVLYLSLNNFTGSIPRQIGNLTLLKELSFDKNNFQGTIPNEVGDLYKLEILSLSMNHFNGPIPLKVFNISTIKIIDLALNQLSGGLPLSIGLGIPNLENLLVGGNKLSGEIPRTISNASKITMLDMGNNSFSGSIPNTISTLSHLKWLNLMFNNLTMESSEGVSILPFLANLKDLENFMLSHNPLNSMLPTSIENISTSLQSLELSNCKMWGSIPKDIGNLSSLFLLNLSFNGLSGSIPATVGKLHKLQGLYFNDNDLQGSIPHELCQLHMVTELLLNNNHLFGSLPPCLGNLSALRSLSVGFNELSSTIPSTLWSLQYILHMNLSSNSFSGSLPYNIGKLKVAINLDFSSNQLSGSIPSTIGGLQNLVTLSLANNAFQGSIPDTFGNLLSIESIDLSNNSLSGVIPKSLNMLLHLRHLNLSFNRLEGGIPTGGPFTNFSAQSFMQNSDLCGAPQLQVPLCRTSGHHRLATILKIVLPLGVSLVVFSVALIFMFKKHSDNVKPAEENSPSSPLATWRKVSYEELLQATNGFHENNLLGHGAFGSVYGGTLFDGINVAIKVFNLRVEAAYQSFDTESEVIGNIRHRNLIKIISCCCNIDFKALVLEYMPQGSLENWLYSRNSCLNFLQRLNIMMDVASALEYLHYGCMVPVVHCDLKPSNVLLDEYMVAHVADFGVAKLLGEDASTRQTITLATVGYMAPEYGSEGIVSVQGDVYSFGILLMETFTRKKPTDEMFHEGNSMKQWVANSLPNAVIELADASLLRTEEEQYVVMKDCLSSIMELALTCSADSPEDRVNTKNIPRALDKIRTKFLVRRG